jgi:hypothetical protein
MGHGMMWPWGDWRATYIFCFASEQNVRAALERCPLFCWNSRYMRLSKYTAMMLSLFFCGSVLCPRTSHAQAMLSCKVQPGNLAEMKNCWRPLLVFSPSDSDPRLKQQEQMLDADADDMMDRFVLFTPIVPHAKHVPTPLDAPWTLLAENQMEAVRQKFRIPLAHFEVMLLNENGEPKLVRDAPIPTRDLNTLIDTWPRRQKEELRRGAN